MEWSYSISRLFGLDIQMSIGQKWDVTVLKWGKWETSCGSCRAMTMFALFFHMEACEPADRLLITIKWGKHLSVFCALFRLSREAKVMIQMNIVKSWKPCETHRDQPCPALSFALRSASLRKVIWRVQVTKHKEPLGSTPTDFLRHLSEITLTLIGGFHILNTSEACNNLL